MGERGIVIFILFSPSRPSVMSAAISYDEEGERSPFFPPIHENRAGDLLKQYSTAVIYTSQTSLHLKAR